MYKVEASLNDARVRRWRWRLETAASSSHLSAAGGQVFADPLTSKEARLANLRRWEMSKRKTTVSYSKEGEMCYYCHQLGHHLHECELKRADLENDNPVVDQNDGNNGSSAAGEGNAQPA
ncbi:hypothetical protein PF010_g13559 [Phytophthora fragariae]|uniref:CCHC-type domain-containing protein n=1 Tax=Phytophthora fragariae TaxID=53985 RepID=A0A6G0KZI1_9STRA|nr:hypothetical protein PF010_g13559 [Phytophthora fragariae]